MSTWGPDEGPTEAEWRDGREVSLFGGVAVQSVRPADADVVAVLRDGLENVVQHSMGIDLTWRTAAITPDDDLESGQAVVETDGLDWDFVRAREGNLETAALDARATALLSFPLVPKAQVAVVHASFPRYVERVGREVGGLIVGLSMHRWAMYGGGEDLRRVVDPLSGWLLDAADRLGADTGYITLDQVRAGDNQSPWERATVCTSAARDVTSNVWGYGWGTLLSPVHLDKIGGVGVLAGSGLGLVTPRPGGKVWLTLSEDPGTLDREAVASLRRLLLPALPSGSRTIEEFFARPLRPYEVGERFVL